MAEDRRTDKYLNLLFTQDIIRMKIKNEVARDLC